MATLHLIGPHRADDSRCCSYPSDNCAVNFPSPGNPPKNPIEQLTNLLTHSNPVGLAAPYSNSGFAAQDLGLPFLMFETNTASCGGCEYLVAVHHTCINNKVPKSRGSVIALAQRFGRWIMHSKWPIAIFRVRCSTLADRMTITMCVSSICVPQMVLMTSSS